MEGRRLRQSRSDVGSPSSASSERIPMYVQHDLNKSTKGAPKTGKNGNNKASSTTFGIDELPDQSLEVVDESK